MLQTETSVDPAIIDALLSFADGDAAFLADLFEIYREQAVTLLEGLDRAVSAGDRVAVLGAAHALRGASLNIGAASVATACRRLEIAMSDRAANARGFHATRIRVELERFERSFPLF